MGRQREGLEKTPLGVTATASPYGADEKLFNRESTDGEYTTWNHILTYDFGVGSNLTWIVVTNKGAMTCDEISILAAVTVDRFGTLTVLPVRTIIINEYPLSATHKYLAWDTWVGAGTQVAITREGLPHWNRNIVLDNADARNIEELGLSPSGQYLGLIVDSLATLNDRYLMLYEGS